MSTSPDRVDYDPLTLRQLAVDLMGNPTRANLNDDQREGYRAAVTSIDLLSQGMAQHYLAAGFPDLAALAKDAAEADAILKQVPAVPMPADPVPVTLDRGNLQRLVDVMRDHPTLSLYPPAFRAGFLGCLATIEACLPDMPELYEGAICPNVPQLLARLAQATTLGEVQQIIEPLAWQQWMGMATADDTDTEAGEGK